MITMFNVKSIIFDDLDSFKDNETTQLALELSWMNGKKSNNVSLVIEQNYKDKEEQPYIQVELNRNQALYLRNALNSFILMSPTDKLDFIESFAFKDINLKFLKEKCKDEINKRKSQLTKTTDSLELTKNIFNEMEKPN